MKNATLCEALPLLANVLPRNPTHTTHGLFRLPPRIITIPEQTHTFEFASRRAASLSLTHACCVSSLAPGHNNSPEIKTNLLLSHLFLFFFFLLTSLLSPF
nr:CLL_HP1_G0054330.mRNA.1.CDS.1 [Saccharomyces cerevisiae]